MSSTASTGLVAPKAADAAAARSALPLYFVNAPTDFLLIGGVSIVAYFCLSLHPEANSTVFSVGTVLMWLTSWPHFAATSYRLYSSKDNIREYPVTALVVPLLIAAGVAASFASLDGIAPYFVRLFLFWSPYHFCGQSVGITLIYARRAGFKVGKKERLAISSFIFGTFFLTMARAETGTQGRFDVIQFPYFGLPPWVANAAEIGLLIAGAAFGLFVVQWCLRNRRVLPLIVLLPAVTQYFWFVLGGGVPSFNNFVPMFHAAQYLLIAWSMQLKESADRTSVTPTPRFVWLESVRWGAVNLAGGALLFWGIPQLLASWQGLTVGVCAAIVGAGVQIHHFFVDGVIWKLRNPKVASPLMVNLKELLTRDNPALVPAASRVQPA